MVKKLTLAEQLNFFLYRPAVNMDFERGEEEEGQEEAGLSIS